MNAYPTYLESTPDTIDRIVVEFTVEEATMLKSIMASNVTIPTALQHKGLLSLAADFTEISGPLHRALVEVLAKP